MSIKKTLRFDDDVLTVLQSIDWQNDGTLGIITSGQLERDLYLRVDKALQAMGGKWNRRQGGHLFASDPREQVESLLQNGSLQVEKDGFFETPPTVVERMLELVDIRQGDNVLEPSAGLGAIANHILRRYPNIALHVCEKNPQRAEKLKAMGYNLVELDFFNLQRQYDVIVMNPPFEAQQDIGHVRHAYDCLADGGQLVSVMPEGTFFRADHKATEFRRWLDSVGGRDEKLPDGSFSESGADVATRLVIITKA